MASVAPKTREYKGKTRQVWTCRWKDLGGVRRSKDFKFKRDADKYRTRMENELAAGTHTADGASLTVNRALDDWLGHCERRHRNNDRMGFGTLYNYKGYVKRQVKPYFGKIKLSQVTMSIPSLTES